MTKESITKGRHCLVTFSFESAASFLEITDDESEEIVLSLCVSVMAAIAGD